MSTQDDSDEMARAFRALGDPTRLRIVRFLSGVGRTVALEGKGAVHPVNGTTIGDVCCSVTGLDTVTSTISHHVRELRLAGLVDVERRGKFMVCSVNQPRLEALRGELDRAIAGCCDCTDCRGADDDETK